MASSDSNAFVKILAAWFLPPLGVFMQSGVGTPLIINCVLTFFGFVPGIVHALYLITTQSSRDGDKDFWRLIAAFFLPPLGAFMQVGMKGAFWVNCLLTVFFWIPGMVHAAWLITTKDD